MSKNIRKIILILLPILCLCSFACETIPASPPISVEISPPAIGIDSVEPLESLSQPIDEELEDSNPIDEEIETSHPIDEAFEAAHGEPDGSTASMIEYATAYREVWYAEALRIASQRQLSDAFATEQIRIAKEAAEVVESYRFDPDDPDSPYASSASWAGVLYEAEAWRAWAIKNQ